LTTVLAPIRDRRGLTPRRPHYSRTFYNELGRAPTTASRDEARVYYAAINRALDKGGWSRGEWAGLRRLEKRWRRRVDGDDTRWTIVGAKSGRLPAELEAALKPLPDPVYARPLEKGETGE
jgi:hypothetical protein